MRRSLWAFFLTFIISIPLGLQAKAEKKSEAPQQEVMAVQYNTRTAKVLDIDQANYTLSLEGEAGRLIELKVDPLKVKNFKNIKKGDIVKVQSTESIVLSLSKSKKGEKPSLKQVTEKETAPVGSQPGMERVKTTEISAEVIDVDLAKSIVELKGPAGNIVELKAKDPKKLVGVKKGDMVTATYTTAMAISVEPAK